MFLFLLFRRLNGLSLYWLLPITDSDWRHFLDFSTEHTYGLSTCWRDFPTEERLGCHLFANKRGPPREAHVRWDPEINLFAPLFHKSKMLPTPQNHVFFFFFFFSPVLFVFLLSWIKWASSRENLSSGVLLGKTNRLAQLMRLAGVLKFRL